MAQSQVLLVDDDEALLSALADFLRTEGYQAQPARSGDVALILLQQRVRFQLLITDIVLPGLLDGFALARRARLFCPSIPIIYTTGYMPVAHIRAHGAPFGEMLVKPYRAETLLIAISRVLSHGSDWYVNSSSGGHRGNRGLSSTPPMRRGPTTHAA